MGMRVTAVEPVVVEIPLKVPARGVHGTIATQRSALVRVTAGAGVEGWGNVDPVGGYSTVSADDPCPCASSDAMWRSLPGGRQRPTT